MRRKTPPTMNLYSSFLLASALSLLSVTAQAQVATIAVGPRPESIIKAWDGKFYVSIQGPSGALGTFDGEVRQVDLSTGVVTPFVTGLENPRGLAFTGEFLIAADQQVIYKIDRAGNKSVLAVAAQFPFPAAFFNDAAAEEGGKAVYVTEMGRRDLIRDVAPSPNAGRSLPRPQLTTKISPFFGSSAMPCGSARPVWVPCRMRFGPGEPCPRPNPSTGGPGCLANLS